VQGKCANYFSAESSCSRCPCPTCGTQTTCCSYYDSPICVAGMSCPQ
jgi:hypothetical protein